jgi:lysozyme
MPLSAAQLPDPSLPWPLPLPVVAEVAEDEQGPGGGVALVSYRCPAGRWTCGWGETDGVGPGLRWTKEFADQRLCDGLTIRANAVLEMCTVKPTGNQLGALVRISYNIGTEALRNSSIMRAHNRADFAAAARAFGLYIQSRNPATGQFHNPPLRGLVTRRAREAALYLTPDEGANHEPVPQAVVPESSLARSPMMTAGGALPVATGVLSAAVEIIKPTPAEPTAAPGAGVVGQVAQVGQHATTVQTALGSIKGLVVDTVGIPQSWWLPLVLIGTGATVMWWRKKQRSQGWA